LQLVSSASADGEDARREVDHAVAPELGDRDLDEWERTAHAYGYEIVSVAPDRLLPGLLADFSEVAGLLKAQPTAAHRLRLTRVAGQLAALTAMTFVNMGQPQTARRWWRTARRATNSSADPELAALVRGRQAVLALYGGYTPEQVLALADEAIAINVPCTGVAGGLAARAQALAIMGKAEAARQTVTTLTAMFDRLPDAARSERASVYAWSEQRLRHVQSYVHTRLGETQKAAKAQERALALYPATNYQGRTQIHLHRAACLIMDGHVSEGVRYATDVLAALPAEYRKDGLIQGCAHAALAAVPHSDRSLASVSEYRELLAPMRGPVALHG
jgi:tetratricopeptide (TPR) repeat protein